MELMKKHTDTVIVLGGILASVFWMNKSMNKLGDQIASLDKRLTVIETVMIMKGDNIKGIAANKTQKND
jgi:hypothetical protein